MVSLATCGNYGVAMALASDLAGIACKIYIPESYHTDRVIEMESLGAEIIRIPGSYEDVVTESSRLAAEHGWYDANPGGARFLPMRRSHKRFLKIWATPQNTVRYPFLTERCLQVFIGAL